MVIDTESFTELAVHLKLASDAVLSTARNLAVISGAMPPEVHRQEWEATLDSLMNMNKEIQYMERLLRALMEANRGEPTTEPQPS
jgi:predicted translin family RNA/ssDNA-binding protein